MIKIRVLLLLLGLPFGSLRLSSLSSLLLFRTQLLQSFVASEEVVLLFHFAVLAEFLLVVCQDFGVKIL